MSKMIAVLICLQMVLVASQDAPAPITCASTTCLQGSVCREVLDQGSGLVTAVCFGPGEVPVTGNENRCNSSAPLLVNSSSGLAEVNCGRSINRIDCPSGYSCLIAPNDAYAVCCLDDNPVDPGVCPKSFPSYTNVRCRPVHYCSLENFGRKCSNGNNCCPTPCGRRCIRP